MAASREPWPVPPVPAGPGELVCENGPQPGSRRALIFPLTLIGQSPDCDIRLPAGGVNHHHCAIVLGPSGLVLRDLSSSSGTMVNGEPVGTRALRDGDVICVGPFQFRVSGSNLSPQTALSDLVSKREAEQHQEAAEAARQAALADRENKLVYRELAVEQREQHLAGHLEVKRDRLLSIRDEARQARAALEADRESFENRVAEIMRRFADSRRELGEQTRQLQRDRFRLISLRRRLKLRWHRMWGLEREKMDKQSAALIKAEKHLEAKMGLLRTEEANLAEIHVRLNAEVDVARHGMAEELEEIRRQRSQLLELSRLLRDRECVLEEARKKVIDESASWDRRRERLTLELAGLEERIQSQRRTLQELEQDLIRQEFLSRRLGAVHQIGVAGSAVDNPVPDMAVTPESAEGIHDCLPQEVVGKLDSLLGQLADQRAVVLEELARLASSREHWLDEQRVARAEIESRRGLVDALEQDLLVREDRLETSEQQFRSRLAELAKHELSLQAKMSRLAAAEADWEGERARLLADLSGREQLAEKQLELMVELRGTWQERRRQQVSWLRSQRAVCENERRVHVGLRDNLLKSHQRLALERQTVAEKALALEQYRQEYIKRSTNPAVAEKRIDRLRRRWERYFNRARKILAREQRRAQEDGRRVAERARAVEQQLDSVATRELALGARENLREMQIHLVEAEMASLRQDAETLAIQQKLYEKQLHHVREELDGVTRMFLVADDSPPSRRAA
jgi:hypothetical protein